MPSSVSARRRPSLRARAAGCDRTRAVRTGYAHRVTVHSFESRSLPSGPVAPIGRTACASAVGNAAPAASAVAALSAAASALHPLPREARQQRAQILTRRTRVIGRVPEPRRKRTRAVTRCGPGARRPRRVIVSRRCSGLPEGAARGGRRRRPSRGSMCVPAQSDPRQAGHAAREPVDSARPATPPAPAVGGRGPGGMTAPGTAGWPGTTGVERDRGRAAAAAPAGRAGPAARADRAGSGGSGGGSSGQSSVVSIVLLSPTVTPPAEPLTVAVLCTTDSSQSCPGLVGLARAGVGPDVAGIEACRVSRRCPSRPTCSLSFGRAVARRVAHADLLGRERDAARIGDPQRVAQRVARMRDRRDRSCRSRSRDGRRGH